MRRPGPRRRRNAAAPAPRCPARAGHSPGWPRWPPLCPGCSPETSTTSAPISSCTQRPSRPAMASACKSASREAARPPHVCPPRQSAPSSAPPSAAACRARAGRSRPPPAAAGPPARSRERGALRASSQLHDDLAPDARGGGTMALLPAAPRGPAIPSVSPRCRRRCLRRLGLQQPGRWRASPAPCGRDGRSPCPRRSAATLQGEADGRPPLTLHDDVVRLVDELAGQVLEHGPGGPAGILLKSSVTLASVVPSWRVPRCGARRGTRTAAALMTPAPTRMRRTRSVGWAPSLEPLRHPVRVQHDSFGSSRGS